MMSSQAAPGALGAPRWSFLAFLGLLIGVLVAGGVLLSLNWREVEYAVVMDSGSTGTRCYVYSWARSGAWGLPKVVDSTAKLGRAERFGQKRTAYKRVETEPGLDQFVGDVVKVNQALDPLIQYALKEVPESKRPITPVFLFATAGLRRLPQADSAWLLQMAQQMLSASPFLFEPEWARIISGQDEAVYGWIALNYLTGKLSQGQEAAPLGSLDMGGSSLEVTFLPEAMPSSEHGVNVTIKETDYHLYAHSHPSFGMNDAFQKSVLFAMEDNGAGENALEVEHPCLHTGYNDTYRFKKRRSDAAVSTSAVADKALKEGHGRRLLRWAAENVPFRSKVPTSGLHSLQQSPLGSSQPARAQGVNAGQGFLKAFFDTVFRRPLVGDSELQSTPSGLHGAFTALGRRLRRFTLHQDSRQWRKPPSDRAQIPSMRSAQVTHAAALTTALQASQLDLVPYPHNPSQGHRQESVSEVGTLLHGESPIFKSVSTPVSQSASFRSTDSTSEKEIEHLSSARGGAALARRRVLEERSGPTSVKLIGRPDWQACQALVDRVVTSAEECEEEPCALGAHQPALRGNFMALTGFFVVYHFFGLAGSVPLDRLLDAGQAFCKKTWTHVKAEYYGERGLDRYCFRAPYVVSLLRKGLGLRDDQIQIGTGDMAWTLGAALYEGGALKPAAKPITLEDPGAQTMAQLLRVPQLPQTLSGLVVRHLPLVIVVLALVGLTAVTVVRWWKARVRSFDARARRAYLPLYNGLSRPGGQDGGKPGHAFSRRLIERQRAALLDPIPASPPSVPVKAPAQTGLATRRTTSTDAGLELQRSLGSELDRDGEEYSP
ncbi:hypothetical protein KFL_009510020 [Klebsormidium nitens]|uniref:Uncharacterized protein n=1 Tax=Klebsormidium nitens TaxID=105231 RepID=A0A1Y1IRU9_KLENI|nr:hypothetical protein KFL_009510020 [Klebsormidium nitens]|eukprot:GAQ92229.1 hypothetical protein KFL_009510020 [Klebsormidium nitens]